jgi:DNA-binding NarL/FixJ family response regulator
MTAPVVVVAVRERASAIALARALERALGVPCMACATPSETLVALHAARLAVIDVTLSTSTALLYQLAARVVPVPVVVILQDLAPASVDAAMRGGAAAVLSWPVDAGDLVVAVRRLLP